MKDTFWKNRSVLVTGGAGFIGSWICHDLAKLGAKVVSFDLKKKRPSLGETANRTLDKVSFTVGDIRDEKKLALLFKMHAFDNVFHMAARAIVGETIANPKECLDVNVRGTWSILEMVRAQGKRDMSVVVASSDKAYGAHQELPYTEEFELRGTQHPYDCSKAAADTIARMYATVYGINVGVVRSGNVYGEGDPNFSRLIPDTIRLLYLNKPMQIRSNGKLTRDYVYVHDVVQAYCKFGKSLSSGKINRGEAFNLGCNNPTTVLQVVKKISVLMNKKENEPVILNTARHEIKDQYLDSSKAKKILGFKPLFSLEEGLQRTIGWYLDYFEKYGTKF